MQANHLLHLGNVQLAHIDHVSEDESALVPLPLKHATQRVRVVHGLTGWLSQEELGVGQRRHDDPHVYAKSQEIKNTQMTTRLRNHAGIDVFQLQTADNARRADAHKTGSIRASDMS